MNFPVRCYHLEQAEAKYHLRIFCWKNSDLTIDETYQAEKRPTSEGISKLQRMSTIHVALKTLKLLRDRAARLTATCNQMNAQCVQFQSKKDPHCVCSIQRDVEQGLCMYETFPCSCYDPFLTRGEVFYSAGTCLFISSES